MVTYWFWYGSQVVSSVRGPEGMTECDARYRAMLQHNAVPLCDIGENPGDRANKIRMAEIRIYPGEN